MTLSFLIDFEKNEMKLPFIITITCIFFMSCGPKTDQQKLGKTFDLSEVKKIIDYKTKQFTKAHITRDTAFLNNIFTSDAKILPPDMDAVAGRESISTLNQAWVDYDIQVFDEVSNSYYGFDDFYIDEGTSYLLFGDSIEDIGKYVNIWKKEAGEWKLHINIWNSSPLPEAPK
ncbi:MAG: ketosteroid isomerase-like protein [Marinoscillum sp.]|jgi:ketosteroid isomerase-like protein